ncbi:MAG: DUF2330 domain-containing protein [Alphaproteobacteria bacterium]|nr:DUF2330 domain-containing protein [Alphaproteobacteria bacterium]
MRWLPLAIAVLLAYSESARAFCGFYVARADTTLLNHSSKVVLAHSGERTVLTMASDVRGDPKEFAIVIPVPTVIRRDQIRLAAPAEMDHLDAYTAPRLVEYWDPDPCAPPPAPAPMPTMAGASRAMAPVVARQRADVLGVKIEATYSLGEYDILILSARDSSGLLTWLNETGYKVPNGAAPVVGSYLRQNMHFFVAKVNLERQSQLGFTYLRPIQVSYEAPKFMLPIRLGTVNADGPQDLIVLALSPKGRIETTNYRTVRLPSGSEVPLYVKDAFGDFYRAMFAHQAEAADNRAVFLEYAWDMSWCDPCAADPLSAEELKGLGAFWLADAATGAAGNNGGVAGGGIPGGGQPVFATRLHLRYDRDHFPEDLMLQETADQDNFQGRYVLRHPYQGEGRCEAMAGYRRQLARQTEEQARTLAELTGWDPAAIRHRMAETGQMLP